VSRRVRDVTLAEIPALSEELAARVAATGFRPDCIVYLETGARLLAVELCRSFGVGAVALRARRRGGAAKERLGGVFDRLPTALNDSLRQIESRWLAGHLTPRTTLEGDRVALADARVLVVDDAADTGASVSGARAWAVDMGARPADIRVAVIALTSDRARPVVDVYLHGGLCRFPWSSDSRERTQFARQYAAAIAPAYVREIATDPGS
jgi:hypoxanthine phosphoribosyltransferase